MRPNSSSIEFQVIVELDVPTTSSFESVLVLGWDAFQLLSGTSSVSWDVNYFLDCVPSAYSEMRPNYFLVTSSPTTFWIACLEECFRDCVASAYRYS